MTAVAALGDQLIGHGDAGLCELHARALPLIDGGDLDAHVRLDAQARRRLLQQELAIARKYAPENVRTWPYTVVAIACFAAWVAFFPLAIYGVLPLWLGCAISSIFVSGGYVIGHEAMHSTIGRQGSRARFWNELTGYLATLPLILPFSMVREMHLLHHKHANQPDKDPDHIHAAPNVGRAIVRSWLNRQPGTGGTATHWRKHASELGTPQADRAMRETVLLQLAVMTFFFAMAWSGHAIVVALMWWLPRHLGVTYIHVVLSWAPHYPHQGVGRYDNTRIIRHPLGMGIDFHMIHHLYPFIPVHANARAYREMKPLLEARGVDCRLH